MLGKLRPCGITEALNIVKKNSVEWIMVRSVRRRLSIKECLLIFLKVSRIQIRRPMLMCVGKNFATITML